MADDLVPSAPLPDLFAGSQLIVTGRYRDGGATTITLRGTIDGQQQTIAMTCASPKTRAARCSCPGCGRRVRLARC
jgi:hypothetical protein